MTELHGIALEGVTKRFAGRAVLCGVDMHVDPGECVALIGHNGAGKTTLMKLVLGLIRPSDGTVRVRGEDPDGPGAKHLRRKLGYLPENVAFQGGMSGRETLRFYARLKGASRQAAEALLEELGLAEAARRPVRTYSKGMRQRLGLAQAMLGAPELLVLDEPTTGLDPALRREFYERVRHMQEHGTTTLISTHSLSEIEGRADRIAGLRQGSVVAFGSLDELRAQARVPVQIRVSVRWGSASRVASRIGTRASLQRVNERYIDLACLAEIHRLERVFSLYREDSALSRLNRNRELDTPPLELVELLSMANALSERTGGAFDVTVQPLWTLHRNHFSRPEHAASGPSDRALKLACRAVDREAVSVDSARIRLGKPAMALTLNGIAQGFITDRVAAVLNRAGFETVLLDLGEVRALGSPTNEKPWRVGLPGSRAEGKNSPLRLYEPAAVATSAPDAFVFDATGRHHHLFDPVTGRSLTRHAAVTVVAPTATRADALSTAFSLMERADIERVVDSLGDVRVRLLGTDGSLHWVG